MSCTFRLHMLPGHNREAMSDQRIFTVGAEPRIGNIAWVQEDLTSNLCFHLLGYSIIPSHGQEHVLVCVSPFPDSVIGSLLITYIFKVVCA